MRSIRIAVIAALVGGAVAVGSESPKQRPVPATIAGQDHPAHHVLGKALRTTGGGPICATALALQEPDQMANGASGTFGATSDLGVGIKTADNFEASADGSITSLCWWGFYSDFSTPTCAPGADDFSVTYYLDNAGSVGPVLAGPLSINGVAAGPTGFVVDAGGDNFPEYSFTGAHAPVAVNAGTCYWISIRNDTTGACRWLWSTSPDGDGNSAQDIGSGFVPTDFDLAFGLDILFGTGACPAPPAPANDLCQNAQVITDGVTNFTTVGATSSVGLGGLLPGECDNGFVGNGDIGSDVWFLYQATCTGELQVSTCGTVNYDSKIGVYANGLTCPTDNTDLIGCADDDELGSGGEICSGFSTFLPDVPVVAGQWYLVRVGGFDGAQGLGSFELSCGPAGYGRCCLPDGGDVCFSDISGPGGAGVPDGNVDALDFLLLVAEWGSPCSPSQPPSPCYADITGPGGAGVGDGNVDALDLLLVIAEWGSPGNCSTPGPGGSSCVETTEASCLGLGGAWEANVGCDIPCPVDSFGDECDQPIDLGTLTAGVTVTDTRTISIDQYTVNATDPVESCEAAGDPANPFEKEASWWYTFTVPAGGTNVTVSACNTPLLSQDTLLTLWEGECGALVELACDDDACTFPAFGASELFFTGLTPGATYRIFVDVYAGGALDVNEPIRIDVTCN